MLAFEILEYLMYTLVSQASQALNYIFLFNSYNIVTTQQKNPRDFKSREDFSYILM